MGSDRLAMNQEKLIAFDADGVLINSQDPVIEITNQRLGTSFKFEDWITYEFLYREAIRITGEPPSIVAEWMFATPIMLASTPYPDALSASEQLEKLGFRQAVITSRPPHQEEMTKQWFETYYPWIGPDDIHVRRQGSNLTGEEFKLYKIEELKPLTFTDDSAELLQFLIAHQLMGKDFIRALVLRDQPWNREQTKLDQFRVSSLLQLIELLKD